MVETKWAKIINEKTKEVQIGIGGTEELYSSLGMKEMQVEKDITGIWYAEGYLPVKPEPTQAEIIKNQIYELESQITARNLRAAILKDEYAINKITEIEAQIEALRKQLVELENK